MYILYTYIYIILLHIVIIGLAQINLIIIKPCSQKVFKTFSPTFDQMISHLYIYAEPVISHSFR